MLLYLKGKPIAVSGMLVALSVVLIILSGVFEMNTIFLLCAASFLMGVIVRRFGIQWGSIAVLVSVLLGVLLAPNKLYCGTYLGFALYVLLAESIYHCRRNGKKISKVREWIIKGIGFHLLLVIFLSIAILVLGVIPIDHLLFLTKMTTSFPVKWILFLLLMEVCWIIFDRVYVFFQLQYGHWFLKDFS